MISKLFGYVNSLLTILILNLISTKKAIAILTSNFRCLAILFIVGFQVKNYMIRINVKNGRYDIIMHTASYSSRISSLL